MRKSLKEARLRAGLTQRELADAVGCSRENYSAIETGRLEGSIKIWIQLQKVLSIEPADVLYMIVED